MLVTTIPRALFVSVALLLGSACWSNNTAIEQTWTPATPGAFRLGQVVTMFGVRDGVLRRTVEDRMAQRLAAIGVRSAPGYRVLSEDDRSNRQRAIAKLRRVGFDGAIVMRVVGEPENAPESFEAFLELSWPYTDGDLGTVMTLVRMETSAYSLDDNQLVWSALTRTVEPDDMTDLIDEVTQVITRELARRDMFEDS